MQYINTNKNSDGFDIDWKGQQMLNLEKRRRISAFVKNGDDEYAFI